MGLKDKTNKLNEKDAEKVTGGNSNSNGTYEITDSCIKCGLCTSNCLFFCISEGETKYVIDASRCGGCGNCLSICSVGAVIRKG